MGARRSLEAQHLRVVEGDATTRGEQAASADPWAGEDETWSDPETELGDAAAAADEEDPLGVGRALVISVPLSLLLWLGLGGIAYLIYRVVTWMVEAVPG